MLCADDGLARLLKRKLEASHWEPIYCQSPLLVLWRCASLDFKPQPLLMSLQAVREELPYVVILDGKNASTATVLTCIEVQVPVVIVLSATDIQWSDVSVTPTSWCSRLTQPATQIEPKLSAQGVTRIIGPGATGVTLPNLNLFAARESDIVSGKPGRIGALHDSRGPYRAEYFQQASSAQTKRPRASFCSI